MGLYDFGRIEGYPSQYGENKTAADVDVLIAGFVFAFVILACSFFVVLPSPQGKSRGFVVIRVVVSLFIGAVLMTSNFGQDWEVGHVNTSTPYKAGISEEIHASISLKLGLRSLNITLKAKPDKDSALAHEIINYNERFWWTWDQGRFGFGPYAGELQQEFRQAQRRGLPLPILWVADYFTIDGEGIRFGRYYRTAGWFTHIALWSAFPCWLLANILFTTVISYGALFTILTGFLQLIACLLWTVIRNPNRLVIPFDDNKELKTNFGVNFWITLVTGILCVILGIVLMFLDQYYPEEIAGFFGLDPLADYEEYHLTPEELAVVRKKDVKLQQDGMFELSRVLEPEIKESTTTQVVLKRRTTLRPKRPFKRPIVPPRAPIGILEDEEPTYYNVPPVPRQVPIQEEDEEEPMYLNVQQVAAAAAISGSQLNSSTQRLY